MADDLNPDDAEVLAKLKADIEALSDSQPMWSKSAYTHRRTMHTCFLNGAYVGEGQAVPPSKRMLTELAEMTLAAAKVYRDRVSGEAGLVWRIEPNVVREEDGIKLYTRFYFEPLLYKAAKGVWVESDLAL